MKYSFASLTAVVGLASAAVVDTNPISVSLAPEGNHMVKATITNNGVKGLNLFTAGSILDTKAPVNKLTVTKDCTYTLNSDHITPSLTTIAPAAHKIAFDGIRYRIAHSGLKPESFTALKAGESKEVLINMAEVYKIKDTGLYSITSAGSLRYAEADSTKLVGSYRYDANTVSMTIDGPQAFAVPMAVQPTILADRSAVPSDSGCTASQASTVKDGASRCSKQATAAANDALNGFDARFKEYFKSTSKTDRTYVSNRLKAVAKECGNATGGITTLYCRDKHNYCQPGTFAYHTDTDNSIVFCDAYWSASLETTQCHGDDKAGTTLHETTHDSDVFSPGTDDYAYGYTACSKLSRDKALENADTYEYYANAVHLNC